MGNNVIGVKNELIVKWRKSGKSALRYFIEEYLTYYDTNKDEKRPCIPSFEEYTLGTIHNQELLEKKFLSA